MHQHRVLAVPQQVRCYEARTDIGEADVEALHPRKLRQSVDVRILKPLGGGVGGCYTQPLGARYGTDYSDMSATRFFEIVESGGYHSGKSFDIGTCGVQFYFRFQVSVLITHTGT